MTTYDFTLTDAHGEVWGLKYLYNANMSFKGWYSFRNDTDADFIPADIEFSLNGANVVARTNEDAIKIAMARHSLACQAEHSFNANHPELNP